MKLKVWLVVTCFFLAGIGGTAYAQNEILPGYEFEFGTYEQDGVVSNGREPIEWQVLTVDTNNETMMAVSKYLLDCQPYNKTTTETSWKNSHVRKWLNDQFFNTAFSDADKVQIQKTNVFNSTDYVFLLSANQIMSLLDSELCYATQYAKNRGTYVASDTGTSSWWVGKSKTTTYGAFVGAHGKIYDKKNNKVTVTDNGLRPVVVLSMRYLTEDTPGANLNDLRVNDRITIDGLGKLQITSLTVQDKLGYFKAGQHGKNSGDFLNYYDSGAESEYIVLKVSLMNRNNDPMNYLQNASVKVTYDDSFQFGGWSYQYDHDNGTSTRDYVNQQDCGRQNMNYVIDISDNFAVAPNETGYYCFGCTVPNSVLEMQGILKMEIEIDKQTIVCYISK